MKKLLFIPALLMIFASYAFADLYQWRDNEGATHITSDINKVPAEYRDKMKVFKTSPAPPAPVQEQAPVTIPVPAPAPSGPAQSAPLYGDHTLEWWKEAFNNKNQQIGELQSSIAAKKQYISVFEAGRRFGQIYSSSDVETYNKYKQELPQDEDKLATLNDDLSELRRKATIVGVPKNLRGD